MTYDAMQGAFEFLGVEPVEIGDIRGCAGIRGCAKEVVEQIVDTAADRAIDNLINQAAPELPINYSPGGSCSAPGANSFVPGTRVLMADGTTKPIEQVKVGDHVLATDPESGRTEAKPVITLITGNGHKNLVDLTIDTDGPHGDTTDTLTATADHPFWVPALRKWLPAAELQPGMWLQTAAGTYVQITALTKRSTVQRVHNLTVDGLHTYHVVAGDQAVLVHNDSPGRSNPDDVCSRGPYAEESIPARNKGRDWTQDEIDQNNRNGDHFGCHTCGTLDPGNRRGTWVKDHWPPSEWIPDGMKQRLYPQCRSCSAKQGGWVRQMAPLMKKIYDAFEW